MAPAVAWAFHLKPVCVMAPRSKKKRHPELLVQELDGVNVEKQEKKGLVKCKIEQHL